MKHTYSDPRAVSQKQRQDEDFGSSCLALPDGVKLFKVKKEGVVRLDIIPFEVKNNLYADPGVLHYESSYFVHSKVGPNEKMVICPAEMSKGKDPCPICKMQQKMKQNEDADSDVIKKMYPKQRQLFQVIDVNNREAGIQIWDVSYHLFGKQLVARLNNADPDDGYEKFPRLRGGLTLKIGFKEEHFGKRSFFKAETIDFKERAEDYDDDILEKGYCLDDLIVVKDYDEIKAILYGEPEAEDKPKKRSDDDDTPRKRRDDDDEPRRRSDDDEKPKKRASEDDDKPKRRDDDDDRPAKKRDDDEDKPKKRPSDEDDDRPAKRSSKDEDDDKPSKKSDDDDDWPKARREREKAKADEDEDKPKKRPSDEDEDKPKRRSDDDDDRPAKKRDDDEDDKPAKKKDADDDWPADEDDKPAKKRDRDDD